MPANPYVSVPAGTPNQQSLWVQAYYRNLALQHAYQQQQGQYGDALALGLGKGLGAGLDQFFGQWDQTNKFNNASALQGQQDQAQAWRQQQAIQQQNDALAQREQAAMEAEQRKAVLAQILEQQKNTNLGAGYQQILQGLQPQAVPQPDVMKPPADYNDVSQSYPQPPKMVTPQLGDVIQGLPPSLVGMVMNKPEVLDKLLTAQKPPGMGIDEGTARALTAARELPPGNDALVQAILGTTKFGPQTITATPNAKSLLTGLSTAGVLQTLVNTPNDTSPIFQDPLAKIYGNTPAEIRATAQRVLYGGGPSQPGGLFGYESALAQTRGYGSGLGSELGKQAAPMGPEAQNWVNPQTLEAAPQGMSEQAARAAGYVAINATQRTELDTLRSTAALADLIRQKLDPAVIGPLMGRFNTMAEMANAAPQSFADLRAVTERYRSDAARAAAGAAIGPAEKEIYFSTYPVVTMSPQLFQATLGMVETGLRIMRGRVLGGAAAVPKTPEVPIGQTVTLSGQSVVIDKANADGSLTIHDPITGKTGTWRP